MHKLRRFPQTPRTWLWSLALAASILCAPARAGACIVAQSGPFFKVRTQHVPANGVLVVGYYCYTDCGTGKLPTELVIMDDTDGSTVPGSVIRSPVNALPPDLIVWRPDQGFQEGHSYRIESAQDAVFWAVATMAVDASALELASGCTLEDRSFGQELCCQGICGSEPCISAAVQRVPACHVDWWTGEDVAGAQYLGQVTWSTADEPGTTDEWQWAGASHDFSAQAEQYCYQLELVSLIDASRTVLPKSCLPHGSLGEVGVFAKFRTDFVDEVTSYCEEVPAGVADTWCAGVDAACTEGDRSACEARSSECNGGAGQGGQGAGGQVDAKAGQAAGGQSMGGQLTAGQEQRPAPAAGADGSEPLDLAQDSGCSCSVPGTGGRHLGMPTIALMTLTGIWNWRRRRAVLPKPKHSS